MEDGNKILGNGCKVAPLGTLDPVVKPTCHIFVADKGQGDVCSPSFPTTMLFLRDDE
jgi:hypothetical protein